MPDLRACDDALTWDGFVAQAQDGSLLQSWSWGALKARYGWTVSRFLWIDQGMPMAGASILGRRLPGGLALHYAPRGPVLNRHPESWPAFWAALRSALIAQGGTVLKLDPEWTQPADRALLVTAGARPSRHPIQHQATMVVDISGGDLAFARLKESTRRNIRAGERQGIAIEASDGEAAVDAFYELLCQTASRRRFVVRPRAYYQDLVRLFAERGQASVYLARHRGQVLAGAIMLFFGRTLVYLFGGTADQGADHKPGYLLHWRAIEDAQRRGCVRYDMWGIPVDPAPGHPGYGYYVFKTRFNGEQVRYIGLYDLPVRKAAALTVRLAERLARGRQPEFV